MRTSLLSNRYLDDGVSLVSLNDVQRQYLSLFYKDPRIERSLVSSCPICNNSDMIMIAQKDRYAIPLDTVVCKHCGLLISQNPLTGPSAEVFYSEYYRQIHEGIDKTNIESCRWRYSTNVRKIPRYVKNNSVVIEIGTGGGWHLMNYKMNGIEHYGFDLGNQLIEFGRDHYGLNLYVGSVQQAVEMKLKADYVILLHVIEHVVNPVDFMLDIKSILKDGALISILVPSLNYIFWGGGETGHDLLATLQLAHNFLFDEKTLHFLAERCGFSPIYICGGNMLIRNDRPPSNAVSCRHPRGERVIRYLRFCEAKRPLTDIMIPGKFQGYMHHFHYLTRPVQVGKALLASRFGIIRKD